MCEPITLSTMATIASVSSAALGAYGAIQSGKAQAASARYSAQVMEQNAQLAENDKKEVSDAAAIERRRLGAVARQQKGAATASAGAMGLDPGFGSPADLIGDIDQAYKIDQSILGRNELADLKNLDREASDYRSQAKLTIAEGKSAQRAGYLSAAGSLLSAGGQVADKWYKAKPAATTSTTRPVGRL